MNQLYFSLIIPVYNRPDEIKELLDSLLCQDYEKEYEIVLVEDGSTFDSKSVVAAYNARLNISYYQKKNTGPGDSRNYGMKKAKGNYFIVLDSDCLMPPHYLSEIERELQSEFTHCFGGPDAAHESFTTLQKAINYAMTSFLTTGGIRGGKQTVGKFQPRSFNLGLSKEVFEKTDGFGNIHPGEDPDLTFRIWKAGYTSRLFPNAFVYHKRRIDWKKFHKQVVKFGMVRPILNKWHPDTKKITYWFPTIFIFGLLSSMVLAFVGVYWPLFIYGLYFLLLFIDSLIKNKSIAIALWSLVAVLVQFFGYGWAFLKSTFLLTFRKGEPEEQFPHLFFKN